MNLIQGFSFHLAILFVMEYYAQGIPGDPFDTVYTDPGSISKANISVVCDMPEVCRKPLEECESYHYSRQTPCPVWDGERNYDTVMRTIELDTLDSAHYAISKGFSKPAVMNMANCYNVGGGFERVWGSQEEFLFRRTSLGFNLWPHRRRDDNRIPELDNKLQRKECYYPITECGGIYSPNVLVMRNQHRTTKSTQYQPEDFYMVAGLSIAAQDLRYWMHHVKEDYSEELSTHKMRTLLYMASSHGHKCLILGAIGCGAFQNNPKDIARIFHKLLTTEFKGVFQFILFGVIKSKFNLDSFGEHFEIIKRKNYDSFQLSSI